MILHKHRSNCFYRNHERRKAEVRYKNERREMSGVKQKEKAM
jgi:hypothetical protein